MYPSSVRRLPDIHSRGQPTSVGTPSPSFAIHSCQMATYALIPACQVVLLVIGVEEYDGTGADYDTAGRSNLQVESWWWSTARSREFWVELKLSRKRPNHRLLNGRHKVDKNWSDDWGWGTKARLAGYWIGQKLYWDDAIIRTATSSRRNNGGLWTDSRCG